jgi:hypothetical protein
MIFHRTVLSPAVLAVERNSLDGRVTPLTLCSYLLYLALPYPPATKGGTDLLRLLPTAYGCLIISCPVAGIGLPYFILRSFAEPSL